MKLRIEHRELERALKRVSPAAMRSGGSRTVLCGVRLEWDGDTLTVACTDLDLTITTTASAQGTGTGVTIPPLTVLQRVLQSMGDVVTIEPADGRTLTISSGDTHSTINTLPATEWPKGVTDPADGATIDLDADEVHLISRVLHAASASDEPKRLVLTGVLFDGEHVVTTDSFRAAIATVAGADFPSAVIPQTVLSVAFKEAKTVSLTIGDRLVSIASGSTTWNARLLPGDFPRWQALLRDESPVTVDADRVELLAAVKSVGGFGGAPLTRIVADGDTLTLTTEAQDVGEIVDVVPYVGQAVDLPMGVDPRYLADLLDAAEGERVVLELVDTSKPIACTDGDLQMVLVLVRLPT